MPAGSAWRPRDTPPGQPTRERNGPRYPLAQRRLTSTDVMPTARDPGCSSGSFRGRTFVPAAVDILDVDHATYAQGVIGRWVAALLLSDSAGAGAATSTWWLSGDCRNIGRRRAAS